MTKRQFNIQVNVDEQNQVIGGSLTLHLLLTTILFFLKKLIKKSIPFIFSNENKIEGKHTAFYFFCKNTIVFAFLLSSKVVFAQNPITGNQGFQIITEGNFTSSGSHHIHGPLAVGGDLIINSTVGEINMDNVGSYIFPGDGAVSTGLMVKGGITWTNGYLSVANGKYIHIGNSTGCISSDNGSNQNTQVYPTGTSFNNAKRIQGTIDQTPSPAVFQTVTFDFTSLFTNYRSAAATMAACTNTVQLYNTSGVAISGNNVTSAQDVKITSLAAGTNYLDLTTTSLNNITNLTFQGTGIPSASKLLVISVPLTANFVWNNSNMSGIGGSSEGPYIIWNFCGDTPYNLTLNTASQVVGSIFAPNHNFIKTGTGDTEGNIIAKTAQLGLGEIHNYQFNGTLARCTDCTCTGNLLTNPSFETSDFTGWTLATNDAGQTSFAGDNTYAICGNRFAYFNPTAGNATDYVSYYQNKIASAGQTFNFTVFAGVHDNSKDHQLRLQFFNASNVLLSGGQTIQVDNQLSNPPSKLIPYNLTGTAPTGTSYVRVTAYCSGAWSGLSIALKIDGACLTMEACSNVTTAGTIGSNQSLCGTFDPALLTQATAASGGTGTLVYQWQSSTDNVTWSDIVGATASTYDPPALSSTQYFRRAAKRSTCTTYLYSNVVTVQVGGVVANAGVDITQCYNGYFPIAANFKPSGQWGQWSVISGSGVFLDTDLSQSENTIIINPGVTTVLRWTMTDGTCTATDDITLSNTTACSTTCPSNSLNINGDLESEGNATNFNLTMQSTPALLITKATSPLGWEERYGSNLANTSTFQGAYYIKKTGATGNPHSGTHYSYLKGSGFCYSAFSTPLQVACGRTYKISVWVAAYTVSGAQQNAPFKIEYSNNNDTGVPAEFQEGIQLLAPASTSFNALNWIRFEKTFTVPDNGYTWVDFYFTSLSDATGIMIDDACITEVSSGSLAIAGADQTSCTNTFAMAANTPPSGYTGTWTAVNGAVTFANANSPTTAVTMTSGTVATLRWTVTNGTCSFTDDVVIGYTAGANISVNSPTACSGANSTLTVTGCTGSLLWSTGATTSSITVNPTTTTNYTVTCTTNTTSSNLLLNPNFESVTNLQNWSNWGNAAITTTAGDVQNGTKAVKVDCTTSAGGFGQDIAAVAGEYYTVTFWAKVSNANPGSQVGIKFLNSAYTDITPENYQSVVSNTYQQYTLTGTAPLNTAYITIWTWSETPAILYVDNITVTKSTNCVKTATSTVTVNAAPTASITGNSTICNGSSTTLTASGGGSYLWSNAATTAAITVNPTTTTTYTVTVTNASGCKATASQTVTVNPLPTASVTGTNTICNGASTTLTASGGGTYLWSNAATTAAITVSPSTTTTYTVTVTLTGCTATSSRTVTVNALPTASITGTTTICNGSSTTLTASGGSTYLWSNAATTAAITVNPSTTTNYTVTVTNASGCTAVASQAVTVNPLPTASVTGTNTICNGASTTLTASGGGTYLWSNAATTAAITVNPSTTTTYTVTVTLTGCTATSSRTVTVNALPTASITGTTTICIGSSTTLTASGGSTYLWSNAATTATITVNPTTTTTYTVTVTNASGCSVVASQAVTVNPLPTASVTGTNTICNGASTALTASGGGTYLWSNAATTAAITVNPTTTTTYTVTVTLTGCTATSSRTVTVNALPTASITGTTTICNGASTTLTASGGGTYLWSNAATTAAITVNPSTTTTYTVTVTLTGCTATSSRTVTVNAVPSGSISGTTTVCNGVSTTLTVSGGTSYVWSTGATTTTLTVSPTTSTTYTVTVTGANGCTSTVSQLVTVLSCGTVGNYVWNDTNVNGLNDEIVSAGINGVAVELWNTGANTIIGGGDDVLVNSTTTVNNPSGNPGYYNFYVSTNGNYFVKFPTTNSGKNLTIQTSTAANDNNSDADRTTGYSTVFAIDVNGAGANKNNSTIDAAYFTCPTISPAVSAIATHDNGTVSVNTDDYITFLLNPDSGTSSIGLTYSVTATQGGSPITILQSNGSAATGLYFGYLTPLKTQTGKAGLGNLTLTITTSLGCTQTIIVSDPGVGTYTPCTAGTQTYTYRSPFLTTNFVAAPVLLPKFDNVSGTRTLTQVNINYNVKFATIGLYENQAVSTSDATFTFRGASKYVFNGVKIDSIASPVTTLSSTGIPAGIVVPDGTPTNAWTGDVFSSPNYSTLSKMQLLGLAEYMNSILITPSSSSYWVTNITGNATHDDDITIFPTTQYETPGSKIYTLNPDLANYTGSGNIPFTVTTDVPFNLNTTAGNGTSMIKTKAYIEVTVTYTYANGCNVPPVITNFLSASTATTTFKHLSTAIVVDYDATDANNDVLTWSITGGVDAAKFSINSSNGYLTFNTPPNFYAPTDADGNNTYIVQITVNDNISGTDVQLLTVEITNLNIDPRRDLSVNKLTGLEFSRGKLYGIIDSVVNQIFSIDTLTGAVLQTITIGGATNVSWQDLACDEWYLYIGDFGNATNGARTDLKIYRIDLDDIPATGNYTIPAANVAIINFTYEDQTQPPTAVAANSTSYDCNAMLIRNNVIHLFTKDWSSTATGFRTKEYLLPAIPGTFAAKYYGTINNLGGLITGADNAGPRQVLLVGHNLLTPASNYAWTIQSFTGDAIYGGTIQKNGMSGYAEFGQVQGISFGATNRTGYFGSKKITLPELTPASLRIFNTTELMPNGLNGVAGEGLQQGMMRYNSNRNRNEYYDGLYWRPLARQ